MSEKKNLQKKIIKMLRFRPLQQSLYRIQPRLPPIQLPSLSGFLLLNNRAAVPAPIKLKSLPFSTSKSSDSNVDKINNKVQSKEEDYLLFHPVYSEQQLNSISPTHVPVKGVRATVAFALGRLLILLLLFRIFPTFHPRFIPQLLNKLSIYSHSNEKGIRCHDGLYESNWHHDGAPVA
jgi:hypothetical protein